MNTADLSQKAAFRFWVGTTRREQAIAAPLPRSGDGCWKGLIVGSRLEAVVDSEDVILTPFTEFELLQGCREEREWALLLAYLRTQEYVEPARETWAAAARIFFDLKRSGPTVRSPIDCCIAQLAIEHELLLLHRDRDFLAVADARPLQQHYFEWP